MSADKTARNYWRHSHLRLWRVKRAYVRIRVHEDRFSLVEVCSASSARILSRGRDGKRAFDFRTALIEWRHGGSDHSNNSVYHHPRRPLDARRGSARWYRRYGVGVRNQSMFASSSRDTPILRRRGWRFRGRPGGRRREIDGYLCCESSHREAQLEPASAPTGTTSHGAVATAV